VFIPADEARVDPGTPVSRQTKRSRKYERRIASLKKSELWFDAIDLVEACFPQSRGKGTRKPEMKAVLVSQLWWSLWRFIIHILANLLVE
jgi:hypothetical protein